MGAVMSHLGARVLSVLKEDRPYELRDTEDKPVSKDDARRLIIAKYQVPDEIRRERRRRNSKNRETATDRANEAAKLLNLYKPKPSPANNSNLEKSEGQAATLDNH